ncbi:hypothetical protein HIM_11169 [Hirsutella minnesotensis 3608]|uniref:Uncharacterized protein n=1 Tax=Hirsutella minnesotensis 3608 TaxID=1043627 RepID=A0A0F7ZJA0_9HYPO|nr:hypothetical protein HIM_11169 [Hirsutella minnesotensis 3608]
MTTSVEIRHRTMESALRGKEPGASPPPPEYRPGDCELADFAGLGHTPSSSSSESLPQYESVAKPEASTSCAAGFEATLAFQVDSLGHPCLALPFPPRPDPIPVYSVLPTGELGPLAYQSLRETRRSGDCVLLRAGDAGDGPVSSTAYRFGPNRPPKISLLGDVACDETLEVRGTGCHTRAQDIRTPFGAFQWRYASRAERKAVGASSLLVLNRITTVAVAGGKHEESRRPVARLVRNEALRTEGTGSSTAGNGGRLLMDLRAWTDTKRESRQMEVFVIASCIAMLKKEVDRRRLHQFIIIAGAASGGGP